uniref:Transformer 2 beta homolog n=1 Tax=Eptatretus burgeri TaxID=7764 RepID=A0A8C4Q9B0_EPTBU
MNPEPNECLGIFGLSYNTTGQDLRDIFSRYGPLSDVSVVLDQQTGRPRGFAFVSFENLDDAREAKEQANGMEVDGRNIRVDFFLLLNVPTHQRRASTWGALPSQIADMTEVAVNVTTGIMAITEDSLRTTTGRVVDTDHAHVPDPTPLVATEFHLQCRTLAFDSFGNFNGFS